MTEKAGEDFRKGLLDHVGPNTKNFCAAIMALGTTLTLLGFNVSGPFNRVANAWAHSYEIRNEANTQLQAEIDALRKQYTELEALAHPPTASADDEI